MPAASLRSTLIVCLAIVLGVIAAYAHVVDCGFLVWDDNTHVTQNPLVLEGVKWDSVKSAFAAPHAYLWIPLTWLSFMVDVSIFGLNAAEMHVVNVLLHAANAVLLFLLLKRATTKFWPSAAVAALFALHPINVESVAWITERKNVLCLFFGLWSLHAYTTFAQRASKPAYLAAFVLFGLALLAKPMLVSLPAGLLLLDAWPFRRLDWTNWKRRALEKLPFLLLAIVSSLMTMKGSQDADKIVTLDQLPVHWRVSNALVSYGTYLCQFAWPSGLGVLYPYPQKLRLFEAGLSLVIVIGFTFAAWKLRRKFPYLLIGWLWFLGMLVPNIGVVQAGSQAHADRFTYTAQLGIFTAVVWLIADLWGERPRRLLAYAGAIVGAGLTLLTLRQVEYWTNSATLFEHTIAVTERNALAYAHAGLAREQLGDHSRAVSHLEIAVRLAPDNYRAWNYLSSALINLGRNTEAADAARRSLALMPNYNTARLNLASAYERMSDDSQAITKYRKLVKTDPAMGFAHYRLGVLLSKKGEIDAAAQSLTQAAQLSPSDAKISEALRRVTSGSVQ